MKWGIGIISFLFLIFISFNCYKLLKSERIVTEIKISYVLPTDSLGKDDVLRIYNSKTDSLIYELNKQEKELETKYALFLKAREDDSDFTRFLSVIGGFILAIFALFGVKSYNDLENLIDTSAKNKANEVAEAKANEVAETKACEVAEAKANEVAETKAREVAEAKANEVAETKACEVAEAKANEVAETKAREVAEAKANEVAETKAREVAEAKANEVAETKAREVAEIKAREVAETKANEVAGPAARDEVNELIRTQVNTVINEKISDNTLITMLSESVYSQIEQRIVPPNPNDQGLDNEDGRYVEDSSESELEMPNIVSYNPETDD